MNRLSVINKFVGAIQMTRAAKRVAFTLLCESASPALWQSGNVNVEDSGQAPPLGNPVTPFDKGVAR